MYRLVVRSLVYHWRSHLGVLAGTALTAAILTGALLVGDSVDHSLRSNALARLGSIQSALESRNRFLDGELVTALRDHLSASVEPALTVPGMAIPPSVDGQPSPQINRVNVVGVNSSFWSFGEATPLDLGAYEVAINARLSDALGVRAGDSVSLRIMTPGLLPRDAPLSSSAEEASTRALCTVRAILPDSGLGRFSLAAQQTAPYNAFVDLAWLREQTGLDGRLNLILVGEDTDQESLDSALKGCWEPGHVGLRCRRDATNKVVQLETDRLYLRPSVADAALALPGAQGALSYLVSTISREEKSTPYSFAVGGPAPAGMRDDQAVINRWLADRLEASVGDTISVTYYELSASSDFVERDRSFTIHSIAEMDALKLERDLMPEFPGLSDVERCEDWDVGMPMDEELLKDEANEAYWDDYKQTPKLIVTLAAGQEMWGNRYGSLMAVRFPAAEQTESDITEALRDHVDPADLGLVFAPVRQQAMDAVAQAMDLGGLFLGMSFFLIVSTLIVTAMLFVFGAQQRASDMGILLALGFRPRQVRVLFLSEAAVAAVAGAGLGALAGTGYTRALIFAVNHYWQGAVAHAAILYHAGSMTPFKGAVASILCAVAAMAFTLRRQVRSPVRDLLTSDFSQVGTASGTSHSRAFWLGLLVLASAAGLVAWALAADVQDIVMPFFGAGALLLLAGLAFSRHLLGRLDTGRPAREPSLLGLALQNTARRRGRSLGVVALLATGCFLVLAVSSMQLNVTAGADERWSGTGGFELFADTTIPLVEDPAAALGTPGVSCVSVRVYQGDDASCLNLNRAQTPRLLGVNPSDMSTVGAFVPSHGEDPWDLLNLDLPDGVVPGLVGDADTAMWGLQKEVGVDAGDEIVYQDEAGRDVRVRLVGTLPVRLSVFQGTVLIPETAFTKLFPSEDGFRMFLFDTPAGDRDVVAEQLNAKFERSGLDTVATTDRLQMFYTVETTYLSMFLVLGGLGMVLSTAALGVLVLRNVLERRREVALLRAVGFPQRSVFIMLLAEHALLLGMGLAVGAVAATVAMAPAVIASATRVPVGLQAVVLGLIVLAGAGSIVVALGVGLGRDTTDALRSE
ncbi:MAG: ABC transporter permease [bacterium]|nr:ABC transporter permease [bacterium]